MKQLRFIPLLIMIALLCIAATCKKPRTILISTGTVISLTDNSASVQGEVIDPGDGISEHGHCWSTSPNPTVESNSGKTNLGRKEFVGTFTSNLSNLANGTLYYVCAYASDGIEPTVYGDDVMFTTESYGQPIVITSSVTTYSTTSATVGGEVSSDGGTSVTERGIYWGTSENPRVGGTKLVIGSGTGSFSDELSGLSPGTPYYVEAYAINSVGTGYGDEVNFTTAVLIVPPTVSTSAVTSFTTMSAHVGGEVTSNGGANVTERGICWSTSANPRSTGTKLTIGSGTGSFSNELTDLSPGSTYYIEAFAQNSAGISYGGEVNFSTNSTPSILQQFTYGGSNSESATSIIQTSDGGYAIAGYSESVDGDITDPRGEFDFWVIKLDSNFDLQWQRSIGGTEIEYARSIIQTSDGGYAVAGMSASNNRDVSGNHGSGDFWVVKLTSNGDLQWQKSLGGSDLDAAHSIIQTSDGGYAVAGVTFSNDGDVSASYGSGDFWIVKLNSYGDIIWQKTFGGSSWEYAYSIIQTSDGGYAVAGQASSNDGDVTGNHGLSDLWIVKLNTNGVLLWQKSYGGTRSESAQSIIQASDGGYTLAGYSSSNDGNVSGNHNSEDYWIVKLDSNGTLLWQKSLGGTINDRALSIIQSSDDGYAVTGYTGSNDGDVTDFHGESDAWVVKLNSNGDMQWEKSLGGSVSDGGCSIIQTSGGSYVVAGYAYSNDGDVSESHGSGDYWVIELQ